MNVYRSDLAFIHDAGHAALADDAARRLLDELGRIGCQHGTVVDLGCGSGILARHVGDAGFEVIGIDISEAMIALARARAPKAILEVGSFVSVDLPECIAVTAIGEVFNYDFDSANDARACRDVIRRVYRSLVAGGVFMFDVAGRERARPGGPYRSFVMDDDWAVLVETTVSRDVPLLTREITTFRKAGDLFRRDAETHRLSLFDPSEILDILRKTGFDAQAITTYGSLPLPQGLTAFLARKPVRTRK